MSQAPTTINFRMSPCTRTFFSRPEGIKGMRGPVGSGKSVSMCMYIRYAADWQIPDGNGVKRSKWLILRQTYKQLKETTIKTWMDWHPTTRIWDEPPKGRLVCDSLYGDGTTVELDLLFMSMDQPNSVDSLKSLEVTGVWANEAVQMRWEYLYEAYGRTGRYPKVDELPDGSKRFYKSFGMIMDTNSPDDSHWWYRLAEERKPKGFFFIDQPPALFENIDPKTKEVWYEPNMGQRPGVPKAENIENHNEGWGYYLKQTTSGDRDLITRLLLNRYGTSLSGKPVYPEWDDNVHNAREEQVFRRGIPLFLGVDFGRTPAVILFQISRLGQVICLEEITSEDMAITQFTEELLVPLLINKYDHPRAKVICYSDPAGNDPNQIDDRTCIDVLNDHGIETEPADVKGNSFVPRREAVAKLLRERRDGKPALIVGSGCPVLRKGFNGGYHYRTVRVNTGFERVTNEPEKNEFSHIHDALQYGIFGALNGGKSLGISGTAWTGAKGTFPTDTRMGGVKI